MEERYSQTVPVTRERRA